MRHKPNISHRLWFVWINIIAGVHCTMHNTTAPNVLFDGFTLFSFSFFLATLNQIKLLYSSLYWYYSQIGWHCWNGLEVTMNGTASNTDWIRKMNCLFHFQHAWNRTQAKYIFLFSSSSSFAWIHRSSLRWATTVYVNVRVIYFVHCADSNEIHISSFRLRIAGLKRRQRFYLSVGGRKKKIKSIASSFIGP